MLKISIPVQLFGMEWVRDSSDRHAFSPGTYSVRKFAVRSKLIYISQRQGSDSFLTHAEIPGRLRS
jgi:hypothetical protein